MQFDHPPDFGPLSLGCVYRRKDLHDRFGGNRMTGISPSKQEPCVLLFHTEEPSQQFYSDGFDKDGVYWYSGEGVTGNMNWTAANRAVRDHEADGRDLLLFERVQRKDGLWRFSHAMHYIGHRIEQRPDKTQTMRDAIVFGLAAIDSESPIEGQDGLPLGDFQDAIEQLVELEADQSESTITLQLVSIRKRSNIVRAAALIRAIGKCEACGMPAPFESNKGPFLEVHHLHRLSDGGYDKLEHVAAVCPNCHRRCHYSLDAVEYNNALVLAVLGKHSNRID